MKLCLLLNIWNIILMKTMYTSWEKKRQELLELRKKKVDGMIVRSCAKWIYEGEQN